MARLADHQDTIAAVSSAPGRSARAILRVTGSRAFPIVKRLFAGREAWPVHSNRQPLEGAARLPNWASPIPASLLIWPGPRTCTGQDLVEIHTLGSPPLLEAVLGELFLLGARPAQPGEFTRRAFLAGKLDLTQAEAVLAVIEADTPDDLRQALGQLAGGVGQPLQQLRSRLLDLLAEIEAGLDFAEEDLGFIPAEELSARLRANHTILAGLLSQLEQRGLTGRPFRIVLAGPPNAGKSTLFNALLGDDAALVSPEPGTTRDYLVRRVQWDNVEIELVDTAGHEPAAADGITDQAQAARREQTMGADVVLRCLEVGADQAIPEVQGFASGRELAAGGQGANHLEVWTKCDLGGESSGICTSAVTGQGIAKLRERLAELAHGQRRQAGLGASLGRCRRHLCTALEHMDAAILLAPCRDAAELLALELRLALEEVGEMVGAICTDDLLDQIFNRFCIGK